MFDTSLKKITFAAISLAGIIMPALFAFRACATEWKDGPTPTHTRFIAGFRKPQDFLDPMGLDFDDNEKKLYVADSGNARVCSFTYDSMPLEEYYSVKDGSNYVKFMMPFDVAVDSRGTIYVSDQILGKVVAMDFRGVLLYYVDLEASGSGPISPGRLALDEDDNLFVADTTNNEVLVFDSMGRFKHKFGRPENAKKSRITAISAIYVSKKHDRIVVTSKMDTAVLVFNYDGVWFAGFGAHDNGKYNYSFPAGTVMLEDGSIYVADTLRSEVKVYSPKLEFLYNFGGIGTGIDTTIYPVDMDLDKEGNLYVLEKTARRVNVYAVPRVEEAQSEN